MQPSSFCGYLRLSLEHNELEVKRAGDAELVPHRPRPVPYALQETVEEELGQVQS